LIELEAGARKVHAGPVLSLAKESVFRAQTPGKSFPLFGPKPRENGSKPEKAFGKPEIPLNITCNIQNSKKGHAAMLKVSFEITVKSLVRTAVESYAAGFQDRHSAEVNDPDGTINMKIHNVFIAALGPEIQYFAALVRSLDSSLGNMLEAMAVNIARLSFDVHQSVEGPLSLEQTQGIAELLERYKRSETIPSTADYQFLRAKPATGRVLVRRHDSDYYLVNKTTGEHVLIELKIGGDLDNKKARSEKEAILEQYAILSNTLPTSTSIRIYFATAYNRYGEGKPWRQSRVRQFFAEDELLVGADFWNFICQSPRGYNWVLDEYRNNAHMIVSSLEAIKKLYLP